MKNTIILSRNYERYKSGYYHQDLIDALGRNLNCFLYGPGYPNYDANDRIEEVIAKSPFPRNSVDLVICSTSWDQDRSMESVDPHPAIDLSGHHSFQKVYFLNKEYKKLELRFEYIKRHQFDLVATVHPDAPLWERKVGVPFVHLPFAVSLDRFKYAHGVKRYDFGFTGSLHRSHTDYRFLVKQELMKDSEIERKSTMGWSSLFKGSPLKGQYQPYRIYWAEFGAKNLWGRSLLPSGDAYARFLSSFKVFLNTPSAIGIINTRYYELMASNTVILTPESDALPEFLQHEKTCLCFKPDMSDFATLLQAAVEDEPLRKSICAHAFELLQGQTYDSRVQTLLSALQTAGGVV